ncbi:MAG: mechanosensitive ion channel family protein [Bacteroidetes bacterium]|nr:MAG: mechanosensitive ion channel family protein [Bacteroidota bacterium]
MGDFEGKCRPSEENKQCTMTFSDFFDQYGLYLMIIGIMLGAYLASRLGHFFLGRYFRRLSEQQDDSSATTINFLKNGISFVVYFVALLAIVYAIPPLRSLALSLTAGAGILAAILAFASQAAFSNIVGGVFLVLFKPFRVNDRINIGANYEGMVEDITIRHTVIRDWENRRIIIPNSVISKETIVNSNLADRMICKFLEVPVSYDANLDQAVEILRREVMAHPDFLDMRTPEEVAAGAPAATIRAIAFGESGMVLRAYLWGEPAVAFAMSCDLRLSMKRALEAEGIEMAFPKRKLSWIQADPGPSRPLAAPGT